MTENSSPVEITVPKLLPQHNPTDAFKVEYGTDYRRLKEMVEEINKEMQADFVKEPKLLAAAIVMLAAIEVGTKVVDIHRYLGYNIPKYIIQMFRDNLVENRIWRGGKTYCSWFNDDEEGGSMSFMLDCMVACGTLDKSWKDEG